MPQLELGFLFSGVGSPPYSAPEVYYQRELYGNAGYSGEFADIWSIAVILFVMLTGRPPFVRPLAATYSKSLRRCKHFCRLLKGQGFGNISEQAKGTKFQICALMQHSYLFFVSTDLLMSLLQVTPSDRLPLHKIKQHPWCQGPLPSSRM